MENQKTIHKNMKNGLVKIILTFIIGAVLYYVGGIEFMTFYILLIVSFLLPATINLEKGSSKIVNILDKNQMIQNSNFWKEEK